MRVAMLAISVMLAATVAASAADYPAAKEGTWIARDFKFHTGEVLPELKLHYRTLGNPNGEPVLILHGSTGSGAGFLTPAFAGELFGPGQPLDAARYFIVLPDILGAGRSSKPSDGLKTKFPKYNYDDMVVAQHRLVKEGLGIRHLRLVIGQSMGGMHAWQWGTMFPDEMDVLVPMAAQPSPMASRNWMLRRLMIETIRADPDYKNGDYTTQPRMLKYANVAFSLATSGGTLAWQKQAPTREKADAVVAARLGSAGQGDANDLIYAYEASADYDPTALLAKITATVLAINSADDERNPPETGVTAEAMKKIKNGRLLLIPASADTRGHGTTGMAKLWKAELASLLATAPRR